MRVLIDTNILISFLLNPDREPISQVIQAGVLGPFVLLLPIELLQELVDTISKKRHLSSKIASSELQDFITILSSVGETLSSITEAIPAVTRDPKDDYLLAHALLNKADYLVSSDKDLLTLKQVGAVKIVTPREFLKVLDGK